MDIDIKKNQITIFDVLTERDFEAEEKKKEEYENEVLSLKRYVPTWIDGKYKSVLKEIKVSRKDLPASATYNLKKECDEICGMLNKM